MFSLPTSLLGSDDDWIERFRKFYYPKFHDVLKPLGNKLGIPLYGVGTTPKNQFVDTVEADEEAFEKILTDLGFRRNPVACYKHDPHGRKSSGSWVLLAKDAPASMLSEGRQLHITVYKNDDSLDLYAHNEYDWRSHPFWHLRSKDFKPEKGVKQLSRLLNERTYLSLE